jgi:hypothetical protein
MAIAKQAGIIGFRQNYKETGQLSSGGGPDAKVDSGSSGSHRDNNWKKGAAQNKMAKECKVGPDKNLKDIGGGNFY